MSQTKSILSLQDYWSTYYADVQVESQTETLF